MNLFQPTNNVAAYGGISHVSFLDHFQFITEQGGNIDHLHAFHSEVGSKTVTQSVVGDVRFYSTVRNVIRKLLFSVFSLFLKDWRRWVALGGSIIQLEKGVVA
ncbi:MAG: hypothetical protein ACPG32_04505 [Akkermansiaceae bacterium]